MPQSQLPKVPIHRARPLAGRKSQGTAPCALLPRSLHRARITGHADFTERATGVRAVVPGGLSDATGDRCRPTASRRTSRFPGGAAQLESEPAAPPAHSLRRAGRRARTRRIPLDPLPPEVLPSSQGSQPTLPRQVSGFAAGLLCPRETPVSRKVDSPSSARPISRFPAPATGRRVGGLRQTAFRRAGICTEVSGSLHPSGDDLQWTPAV